MAKFAIINENIVSNTIVADSLEEASVIGTAIEYTDSNPADIGWIYDPVTKTFNKPEEEPNA